MKGDGIGWIDAFQLHVRFQILLVDDVFHYEVCFSPIEEIEVELVVLFVRFDEFLAQPEVQHLPQVASLLQRRDKVLGHQHEFVVGALLFDLEHQASKVLLAGLS